MGNKHNIVATKVDDNELAWLKEEAKRDNTLGSVSELIRKALAHYRRAFAKT